MYILSLFTVYFMSTTYLTLKISYFSCSSLNASTKKGNYTELDVRFWTFCDGFGFVMYSTYHVCFVKFDVWLHLPSVTFDVERWFHRRTVIKC